MLKTPGASIIVMQSELKSPLALCCVSHSVFHREQGMASQTKVRVVNTSVFKTSVHISCSVVSIAWPAISDIWLGVRTVPVLSVAKEVAAPARSPTGRGVPEHRQVDAN